MSKPDYEDTKLIQAMNHASSVGITWDDIAKESGIPRVTIWRWRTQQAPWERRQEVFKAIGRLGKAKLATAERLTGYE